MDQNQHLDSTDHDFTAEKHRFQPAKWISFLISLHTSYFTLVLTPQRISPEQRDAVAAITPGRLHGVGCLIVACAARSV